MRIEMNRETENFLESMLFGFIWELSELKEEDWTIYDIEKDFVDKIEQFISDFLVYLEEKYPELYENLDMLQRSFGGNIYFSLSGHGCGFWDDLDSELGEALQKAIEEFAGSRYLFEQIDLWEENGKLRVGGVAI